MKEKCYNRVGRNWKTELVDNMNGISDIFPLDFFVRYRSVCNQGEYFICFVVEYNLFSGSWGFSV